MLNTQLSGLLTAMLFCLTPVVHATETPVTVGASALWAQSPYKGDKNRVYPIPLVDYQNEYFFIHGLQAGVIAWADDANQLSLIATTSGHEFDTSHNHIDAMKRLSKRHITMMMGGQWIHTASWGELKTALTGDVLDQSNGFNWETNYHYSFYLNDQVVVTPGVGFNWLSSHQADYYYGVSGSDSNRSGIDRYHADNSWTPYVELIAAWKMSPTWTVSAGGRYSRFTGDIKDSPLLSQGGEAALWSGVSYTF